MGARAGSAQHQKRDGSQLGVLRDGRFLRVKDYLEPTEAVEAAGLRE